MDRLTRELSRRQFLKASGALGAAVGLGGIAAACSTATSSTAPSAAASTAASAPASIAPSATAPPSGTFNWMTWTDHWYQAQLDQVAASYNIRANLTVLADNPDGLTKLKEVTGQLDMVSADALWVGKYFDAGLIEAFDINQLEVAKQLYSILREVPFWTKPEGYLGYPISWSPETLFYDPAHVSPAPDSWQVLFDPKYKKRVMVENQPTDVMAYMGLASGVKEPYNMTPDELAQAKALLIQLKPNIARLAGQNTDTVAALKNGEVWIATGNLGMELRVKEQGGPELKAFTPKEGVTGFMDAEMIVKGGENENLIRPFLEVAEQAEYIVGNFLINKRPLFNEKAYKLLINQGQQETADRYLYNKPEIALAMHLKGPGASTQDAIDAFNEVFGA